MLLMKLLAADENGSIVANQFHSEESGEAGLKVITNWADPL
jgi:imidazoleglycerol phosphate synthase glutamine amidotransferase subunit HisH